MGHVFISYSHRDTDYAHGLADSLQRNGFDVWIDERLDYGSQWPHELQTRLDSCDAFILIMTPRSYASEWVQNELQRAKRKLKPIFPLLLEGDEPWLSVESTQYYDVRGELLPDDRFHSDLKQATSIRDGQSDELPAHSEKTSVRPKYSAGSTRPNKGFMLASIAGIAILLAAVISLLWSNGSRNSPLPAVDNTPSAASTFSSDETEIPNDPTIIPSEETVQIPEASDFIDPQDVPMRLVPHGNFIMGSDTGDTDERPVHTVYLDDFHIDKYEVTNAFYKTCVTEGACYEPKDTSNYASSQYADHPVVYVDWNMAKTYCKWRGADLPTEAQWEKAARGTRGGTYPWGEGIDCSNANYLGCSEGTTSVTTHQGGISPYGVYDMAGNVWEWVEDWYFESYYSNSQMENPPGPDSGDLRVVRSGAWNQDAINVRASFRNAKAPAITDNDIGFRCALDATP
jgi:formylglycine-generating enzyme required for sulfatase activity